MEHYLNVKVIADVPLQEDSCGKSATAYTAALNPGVCRSPHCLVLIGRIGMIQERNNLERYSL